ncbi:MAG: hypothetical protein ABSC11_04870 [Smithella sp.]|jgi:hypothetical protein
MKRFWLVLLSVGLVLTISAEAFAVDVKVSATFYEAGMYQDKTTFIKNGYYLDSTGALVPDNGGPSTAFFYQRLRVETDFILSPSLKLVTRFNAMERIWGGARSEPGTTLDLQSAATRAENENIGFDWAYVEYVSPIGMFDLGYMDDGGWGTVFGDSTVPRPIASWAAQQGPWTAFFQLVKINDNSKSAVHVTNVTDNDTDKYQAGFIYESKGSQTGLLAIYYRDASNRPIYVGTVDEGVNANVFVLQPYAIVNIGPVKLQAELDYAWGGIKADAPPGEFGQDLKVDNLAGWIDAMVDLKMFYFGGSIAYVAGNDFHKFASDGTIKGGFLTGGMDWNPTLILFNSERNYWAGTIQGNAGSTTNSNYLGNLFGLNDTGMYNAWFLQGRVGVRPVDKLDIQASISHAMADSTSWVGNLSGQPDFVSSNYGTEIDLIATYKINNNLSYMAGFGYLFTGDYFKGIDPNVDVRDNYMFLNKLTLTF